MKKALLLILVIIFSLSPASAFAVPGNPVVPTNSGNVNQSSVSCDPYSRRCLGVLTVKGHVFSPGGTVSVKGKGFLPGHTVTVRFDGTPVGSTTADLKGNASASFTIPSGTNQGIHTITMQGDGTCCTLVLVNKIFVKSSVQPGNTNTNFSKSDVSGQDFDKKQVDHQSAINMGMLVPLLTALAVILTTAGIGIKLLKK